MPTLTIMNGLETGRVVPVEDRMVIGRIAGAGFRLSESGVSRRHAQLTLHDGAWCVEDLGSANGTIVNRRRLDARTTLRHGDVIGIGAVQLQYSAEPPAPEPPTQAFPPDESAPTVMVSMPMSAGSNVEEATWFRLIEGFTRIGTLALDEAALASFVAEETLSLLPRADRVLLLVEESGEFVPRAARAREGSPAPVTTSRRLLRDVATRREAVLAVDLQNDDRFAQNDSLAALGSRSLLCAPILFRDQLYGLLQVDCGRPGIHFGKADLALVLGLASQIGIALSYARLHATMVAQQLFDHDLALAKKVQEHFLPAVTLDVSGYALAVEYRAALAVGGDVYDAIPLDDDRVAFAIGDVSGKGVSAALLAARLATDLRYQAAGESSPAAILAKATRVLAGRDLEGMFVTAALAVLEPATGQLTVANAGHLLPLVRTRAGDVTPMGRAADGPLGLDIDGSFSETTIQLEPGDVLVLFTDGVIEALDAAHQVFGDARLHDAIRAAPGNAGGVCRAIVAAVRDFAGAAPQSDDLTILCLERQDADRHRRR